MTWSNALVLAVLIVCVFTLAGWIAWLVHKSQPPNDEE